MRHHIVLLFLQLILRNKPVFEVHLHEKVR